MKQIQISNQAEIEHSALKENKLMYLFYLLNQEGFPVNEVYEEFKDIPTD